MMHRIHLPNPVKKHVVLVIVTVSMMKITLIIRQIVRELWMGLLPPDLNSMSQQDYEMYRKESLGSNTKDLLDVMTTDLSMVLCIIIGVPAWIWNLTEVYTDNLIERAVLYAFLDVMVSKGTSMVIVFLISRDAEAVVYMFHWSILTLLTWTVTTSILIVMTKRFGAKGFIYAALIFNVAELLRIILTIKVVVATFCNKLTPDIEKTLEPVAARVNYPISKVCTASDGIVTGVPNAQYVGFLGFKIIVISESLIKLIGLPDTRSVFAHELGHWVKGHTAIKLSTRLFQTIFTCCMLAMSHNSRLIFKIFGFDNDDPPHPIVGVLVCWTYILPSITTIILGISNVINYFCEYQADGFVIYLGFGDSLVRSLLTLVGKLNRYPLCDAWYAAFFVGHPDVMDRVNRIRESQ